MISEKITGLANQYQQRRRIFLDKYRAMITQEKLKVYNSFKGNIDRWAQIGSKKEKAIMSDVDWSLVDGFVQDIQLVIKGLDSEDFSINLQRRLVENCDNPETIDQLKKLADMR